MAPLNYMHKGHRSYFTILRKAAVSSTIILPLPSNQSFDQITSTNTTELAASANTDNRTVSSSTTDGTAKTLIAIRTDPVDEKESKIPPDNTNAQRMASSQHGKEKDLKHKSKRTTRMGHSPMLRSPIIPSLLPPKIRLITNSCSSFVTFYSGLLFCADNFHQYSVTLSCIISFCLCRLYQSSPRILFIRINRLTI